MKTNQKKKFFSLLLASSIAIANNQAILSSDDSIESLLYYTDYGVPETEEDNIEETETIKENIPIETEQKEETAFDLYKAPVIRATTAVNIRSEANTECEILGSLYYGETLKVLGELNGWYEVMYNGRIAYVSKDYAVRDYDIVLPEKYEKLVYLHQDSYIYSTPNYKNPITSLLTYNSAEVYQETNGFYLVKTFDTFGYIPKEVVSDLGTKAVVVDISSQTVKLYSDNTTLLTGACVTGKDSTPTRIGLFYIYSRERNTVLKGADYASPVDFWMPFDGNIGLHDAKWRYGVFGGEIYHISGSHGCVNLPYEVAQFIFNNTEYGTPVLVHQ